jgi:hypothetical protein
LPYLWPVRRKNNGKEGKGELFKAVKPRQLIIAFSPGTVAEKQQLTRPKTAYNYMTSEKSEKYMVFTIFLLKS